MKKTFRVHDRVVYCVTKHSTYPGSRARSVYPLEHGDMYSYTVDKYWLVAAILNDGTLILQTRTGKVRKLRPDDMNLRHATLWERISVRRRFPRPLPEDERRAG